MCMRSNHLEKGCRGSDREDTYVVVCWVCGAANSAHHDIRIALTLVFQWPSTHGTLRYLTYLTYLTCKVLLYFRYVRAELQHRRNNYFTSTPVNCQLLIAWAMDYQLYSLCLDHGTGSWSSSVLPYFKICH